MCFYPGFFGEVFRGIWNGTDVAIKVFLEQDLTPENIEDFCNEISILRYLFSNCYLLCLKFNLSPIDIYLSPFSLCLCMGFFCC